MYTCAFYFSAVIAIVLGTDTAKLRYFYSNIDDYTEFPLETAHHVFNLSWYNSSRTTVIFTHGFTGIKSTAEHKPYFTGTPNSYWWRGIFKAGYPQGPAVTSVINSYLEQGESNVVLLNWQEWAASTYNNVVSSYVNWAAPNAKKLGHIFADTLLNMSASGFDLNKTHLVGHSLGAHIFGIAGNTLLTKGIQLPWITGLDPASAGYESRPAASRLHSGSAKFVSVIHSDSSKYGFKRSIGTVDFWPNFRNAGPVIQPGCESNRHPTFSPEDLCNHNRCWQLLIDSLQHPGTILGSHAKNYWRWKNTPKEERGAVVLEIGVYVKDPVRGDYYLTTEAKSPYGLGLDGI